MISEPFKEKSTTFCKCSIFTSYLYFNSTRAPTRHLKTSQNSRFPIFLDASFCLNVFTKMTVSKNETHFFFSLSIFSCLKCLFFLFVIETIRIRQQTQAHYWTCFSYDDTTDSKWLSSIRSTPTTGVSSLAVWSPYCCSARAARRLFPVRASQRGEIISLNV